MILQGRSQQPVNIQKKQKLCIRQNGLSPLSAKNFTGKCKKLRLQHKFPYRTKCDGASPLRRIPSDPSTFQLGRCHNKEHMNNNLTTKRMSMKKYALIALAGLTLAACKKQGGEINPVNPEEGKVPPEPGAYPLPSINGTYASTVGSDNGTTNESKVTTVDVFLYSEEGSLSPAGYERFSGADANLSTPKKKIKIKTGRKRIYIGINLPQSLANRIKDDYSVLTNPHAVNMAELATANDGVMMFSQSVTSLNIKEGDDPANKVTIPVSRLLAKAGVLQGSNLSFAIPGGTVSDLQYTLAQRNKQILIGQLYDFKDANWPYMNPFVSGTSGALTTEYQANFTGVLNADYQAVDASNTATNALKTVYIPENTTQKSAPTQVTYIQVRAKFTPTQLETGATPNADGTFHVMFGQIGTDNTLHMLFFADKTKAQAEADLSKYNDGIKQRSIVLTYDKGYCYFRLYLNEDQVAGTTPLGILRNTFFKAQITKIKGLVHIKGRIRELRALRNPGGGVTPPDPTDPTDPVNPGNLDANIQATITITPWKLITSEHEI
ncbi:hypothetical protein FQR65_LT14718 [Abscondita terminalis]|nr:hypothetical protein FQR65_LT14718 [Abscondita terminalis]